MPFNTLTCVNRYNASKPLDVYRFLRRELGSTYLQFIPIVEIKGFETTAPQKWDPARLPIVGTPAGEAGPSGFGRDRLVRRSGRVRVFSLQGVGRVARPRLRQGAGQASARRWSCSTWGCRRRPASTASSAARASPSSTTAASTPATITSIPNTGSAISRRQLARRHGVLADAGEIRLRQVRHAARSTAGNAQFLRDCWGECPKNRLLRTPDGEPGLNYLCPGLKQFFAHAAPTAEKLAAQVRARPVAAEPRM